MKTKSHLLKVTKRMLEDDPRPDYIIAVELGVSPNSIRNIKTEKHMPSVLFLENLYEYLSGRKVENLDL